LLFEEEAGAKGGESGGVENAIVGSGAGAGAESLAVKTSFIRVGAVRVCKGSREGIFSTACLSLKESLSMNGEESRERVEVVLEEAGGVIWWGGARLILGDPKPALLNKWFKW
jgi:hypothetical protein